MAHEQVLSLEHASGSMGLPPLAKQRTAPMSVTKLAAARAGVYGRFAAVFSAPPDAPLVRQITEEQFFTRASQFQNGHNPLATEAILEEAHWLARVQQIAIQHIWLFCTPGAHFIPPCQSAYPQGGGFTASSPPDPSQLYDRFGFQPPAALLHLPGDHVSVELALMAALCTQEKQAGEGTEAWHARDAQAEFLRAELGHWALAFLGKVERNTISGFYRKAAQALVRFLRVEFRAMAVALS